MAVSARTVTAFGCTSRMPPATNTNSSSACSETLMRTAPGRMRVISGVWPGKMPSSPDSPGSATNSASPEKISSSAETTSTRIVCAMLEPFLRPKTGRSTDTNYRPRNARPAQRLVEFLRFFDCFFDRADHVERLFRQVIEFARCDHLEALDRIFQRNVFTRRAGKHFSNVERLRQETLHLTCTSNDQFVFRCQLVHAQNRDDVTQFLVA